MNFVTDWRISGSSSWIVRAADQRKPRSLSPDWSLAIVLALLGIWVVSGLFGHDPWKPDEAYTFGLARDFVATGDFVVPTLDGEPFVEKPPLFFVVAGAFIKVFGGLLPAHDAARLATALFVVLALCALALCARELNGARAALVAVLAAAGSLGVLVRLHQLITDVALFAGVATGFYGLALARRSRFAGGAMLGFGATVAFLSKGLLGPGWLALTALLLGRIPAWRHGDYRRSLIVALAITGASASLWMLSLRARSPALFHEWLIDNNFGRFLGLVDLGPHNPRWFYFSILPWYAFPALPLACLTLWQARHRGRRLLDDAAIALPLIGFTVLFVVLVSASDSRDLYAMPLVLPLALLAAAGADRFGPAAGRSLSVAARIIFLPVACALVAAWFAMLQSLPGPITLALARFRPGFVASFEWAPFLACGVVCAVTLVILGRRSRDITVGLLHWLAGVTLCWGILSSIWIGYLDAGNSYRDVFAPIGSLISRGDCLYTYGLGEGQRALLPYFSNAQTRRLESDVTGNCPFLLVQGTRSEGAEAPDSTWAFVWQGARRGDDIELYRLYETRGDPMELAHYL